MSQAAVAGAFDWVAHNLDPFQSARFKAQEAQTQISANPVPGAGGTMPLGGGDIPAAGGNAPGATTGTATIPNEQTIINERADAANLALAAYEQQGLSSISNLKVQEQRQESAIVAGAAGRGLKLQGSPLYQLNAQKEAGATVIGSAETQLGLGERGIKQQTLASYNAGLLNMSDKTLSIQTDLSNQWIGAFTNMVSTATSFLTGFWNPAQNMHPLSVMDRYSTPSYQPYMSAY